MCQTKTLRLACRGAVAGAVAVGGQAAGQNVNRFEFVISNELSPAAPSATIQVWAYFNPQYYAFARGEYSVFTPIDPGTFSDPKILLHQKWMDQDPGTVGDNGNSVDGVVADQVYLELNGLFPDEANPLLLWQATWSTKDFTARDVPIWTVTSKFDVYGSIFGDYTMLADVAGEASGTIHVVPAPGASGLVLCLCGLGAMRRRRARP